MQNNRQDYGSVYLNLYIFGYQSGKQDSAPNDSEHSLTSICSFLHEWNFDSLGLHPNISTVPPYQRIYYLSLHCYSILHSDLKTWPYT
jgi:hypothetical protein